jgi:hypothetical protein
MASGRQRRLKAMGMVLTLCLAGSGCRSTPVGQALFGRNADSDSSSKRFVLVERPSSSPPAVTIQSPYLPTQDETVWRPASRQTGQTLAGEPASNPPELASSPPATLPSLGAEKPEVTPIAYRAQDTPVEFAGGAKEPDKGVKVTEDLAAPRPLPGPEVHVDAGMPPPGMPFPVMH